MKREEPILAKLIDILINNLEFLRHDLERRNRLHIIGFVVIAALGLLTLILIQCQDGRGVGDKQEIAVILGIHHRLADTLQLYNKALGNTGGHNLRELIPDNQQSIITFTTKFILNLKNPLLDIVALQPDVNTCYTLGIANTVKNFRVTSHEQLLQLLQVRGNAA